MRGNAAGYLASYRGGASPFAGGGNQKPIADLLGGLLPIPGAARRPVVQPPPRPNLNRVLPLAKLGFTVARHWGERSWTLDKTCPFPPEFATRNYLSGGLANCGLEVNPLQPPPDGSELRLGTFYQFKPPPDPSGWAHMAELWSRSPDQPPEPEIVPLPSFIPMVFPEVFLPDWPAQAPQPRTRTVPWVDPYPMPDTWAPPAGGFVRFGWPSYGDTLPENVEWEGGLIRWTRPRTDDTPKTAFQQWTRLQQQLHRDTWEDFVADPRTVVYEFGKGFVPTDTPGLSRPGNRARERKFKGSRVVSAFAARIGVNFTTEAIDFLRVMWKNIPCQGDRHQKALNDPVDRRPSPQRMAKDVWNNFDKIEWGPWRSNGGRCPRKRKNGNLQHGGVFVDAIINAVQDAVYGGAGLAGAAAARKLRHSVEGTGRIQRQGSEYYGELGGQDPVTQFMRSIMGTDV